MIQKPRAASAVLAMVRYFPSFGVSNVIGSSQPPLSIIASRKQSAPPERDLRLTKCAGTLVRASGAAVKAYRSAATASTLTDVGACSSEKKTILKTEPKTRMNVPRRHTPMKLGFTAAPDQKGARGNGSGFWPSSGSSAGSGSCW
jgi:hypothetical protein